MSTITIIGAGNLAGAVAAVAHRAGATLQVLARDPEKSATVAQGLGAASGRIGDPLTGEIIVLAVPYPAVEEILGTYAGALDGKILIDATNPIDFATFDSLVVPSDSSAAQQIQGAHPSARVVKAFNANFGATLASGQAGPVTTTVLAAGDDADAKEQVLALVRSAGLRGVDAGALKRSRELEAVAFLQISLASAGATPWTGGFTLLG
ncbi:NADPH-dependent F420 reductase [Brachybacterium sp. AOP25-B2-12]|uniref:NADPH-dependent F420 reductase n=1 Tax=Brachybacterium sp. AOP25-B2-12 TaxID=3457710 RepID=UPI004033A926